MRNIYVSDITMNQAAAKAGYSLSFREKIELGKLLDKLGLSVIETGPIINGKTDSLLIKSLASAIKKSVLAVPVCFDDASSVDRAWDAVKEAAHPRLQISVPVSTVQMEYICHKKPATIIETISNLTAGCAALCKDVEFLAEDFGRSDRDFLGKAIEAAVSNGATTVTICDAAGDILPQDFSRDVKEIKALLPVGVRLGVKCANDLFLADTCAVAAVASGADEVKTAPFGNYTTSLERFIRIINAKPDVFKMKCGVQATELQRVVSQIKRLCQTNRSKPSPFSQVMPSDHSDIQLTINDDKEAVVKAAKKLNYDIPEDDVHKVYDAFVRIASKNEVVGSKELEAIIATVAFQVPPTYKLKSFVINSGNIISATCHMKIEKDGQIHESVCVGDGPIDAAFQAIEKIIGKHYELDDFQIQSVTEGREAMGETVVRLRSEGKIYSGRGISTDIVGSSIWAYINTVNKIAYEEAEA